tara:strand:- start:1404 stop:1556 length:153 start_codon:yes stop_codon:yes gene_type:complete
MVHEEQMQFKAQQDKDGKLTIMCNKEIKPDGSVVMHAPSMQLIEEFNKNN